MEICSKQGLRLQLLAFVAMTMGMAFIAPRVVADTCRSFGPDIAKAVPPVRIVGQITIRTGDLFNLNRRDALAVPHRVCENRKAQRSWWVSLNSATNVFDALSESSIQVPVTSEQISIAEYHHIMVTLVAGT